MTIVLEQLADGSVSDRNFQKLMALVLDTGGKTLGLRFGTSSMVWSASASSGPKTISHGLGRVPVFAAVFNADTVGSFGGIAAFTTTNLTVTQFDAYGQAPVVITGTKTIFWLVIG